MGWRWKNYDGIGAMSIKRRVRPDQPKADRRTFLRIRERGRDSRAIPFHDVTKTSRLLLPQRSIAFSAVHNCPSSAISAVLEPAEPALEGTWGHEEIFRHRFAIRRRRCRQRRAGDYAHGA
jgi:hypothetical protein